MSTDTYVFPDVMSPRDHAKQRAHRTKEAARMKILIVGGSGFLGTALVPLAIEAGHEVTVTGRGAARPPHLPDAAGYLQWSTKEPLRAPGPYDAVMNLAGANIVGSRWTASYKEKLRRSRIETNERLVLWCGEQEVKPKVFHTSSAVGYYGLSPEEPVDEDAPPDDDFLARLCRDWEDSARAAEAYGARVVATRQGIILDTGGGALDKMMLPFKLGLGGRVGSGDQPFPWIHRTDAAWALLFCIENEALEGPVNVVAPQVITNEEFTKAFGDALHRPTIFPVPEFGLELVYGEGAGVLTSG
ncbi:MAG: TIGR01777 family oxidoreductase, partial [Euryarchaeota archaeon]|nr:TIGR01777 family oxidoreductase [Euryarchaeota archaeon]